MRHQTLFHYLLGLSPDEKVLRTAMAPAPDDATCYFLHKGHIMEYVKIGRDGKKLPTLFFGPGEFIIPAHTEYSSLIQLDDTKITAFARRLIIGTLRQYPASANHYRAFRQRYHEKVAARIHTLETMTGSERFQHLQTTQAWVLELAEKVDIIAYLQWER